VPGMEPDIRPSRKSMIRRSFRTPLAGPRVTLVGCHFPISILHFSTGVLPCFIAHLFSFASAFKLVVILPVLLMPAAVFLLAWSLSKGNRIVATAAALAGVMLMIDLRFMGSLLAGLDYFSTFQIGLYTQPLGFVLMIVW
jgi:hypothetical protein